MTWTSLKTADLIIGLIFLLLSIVTIPYFYLQRRNRAFRAPADENSTDAEYQATSNSNQDISARIPSVPYLASIDDNSSKYSLAPSSLSPFQVSNSAKLGVEHPASAMVPNSATGTVRRATGNPNTFTEWVGESHEDVTHDAPSLPTPRYDSQPSFTYPKSAYNSGPPPSKPRHSPFPSLFGHSSSIFIPTSPASSVSSKSIHSKYSIPYLPGPTTASTEAASLIASLPKVSRIGEPGERPGARESWGETSLRRAVLGARDTKRDSRTEKESHVDAVIHNETSLEENEADVKRGVAMKAYSGAWP